MKANLVLIIGSGHLALRVKKGVEAAGYAVQYIAAVPLTDHHKQPVTDALRNALAPVAIAGVLRVYIIDEEDDHNLELAIAFASLHPAVAVTTSLFNEAITPHLQAAFPQLQVLNPACIAAPFFVAALYGPAQPAPVKNAAVNRAAPMRKRPSPDPFIKRLVTAFALLVFCTTAFFHYYDGLSWLNAFYFVVVTISTVGYGDFNLQQSDTLSKLLGITLILSSTVFIWMIFSLTVDRIIKKRVQQELGRKRYAYKNHVVLCGLGRLGFFIADDLHRRGEKLIIVDVAEASANVDYFRSRGVAVYTGNARLLKVLQDVNVASARAVISVISDDFANLEIGLTARTLQPGLRLILRMFDGATADIIKEKFGADVTLSMSALADEAFIASLDGGMVKGPTAAVH